MGYNRSKFASDDDSNDAVGFDYGRNAARKGKEAPVVDEWEVTQKEYRNAKDARAARRQKNDRDRRRQEYDDDGWN